AEADPALVVVEHDGENALDLHAELARPLHGVLTHVGILAAAAVVDALLAPGHGLELLEFLLAAHGLDGLVDHGPRVVPGVSRSEPRKQAAHEQHSAKQSTHSSLLWVTRQRRSEKGTGPLASQCSMAWRRFWPARARPCSR